jgi:membrane associated rhomboid family serine protease
MVGPADHPEAVSHGEPERGGTSRAQLTRYQDQLAAKSPPVRLTLWVIGLNLAVYVGMLLSGVPALNPSIPDLLRWGANLGSLTTSGQWWRLFTCTFLHIGIIHILFNMFVLWDIGRFMERLIGSAGWAVVYLLAGLAGSVASLWWNPQVVSAGASGAIFGLYGGLIGYLLAGSQEVPRDIAKGLQKNALIFLGYNLLWGLTHKGIDMAGHLGGLLGGLACGFAMANRLKAKGLEARPRINLQILLAGLAIVSLAAASRPQVRDLQQELARFSETEIQVQARFNQGLQRARSGSLSNADFARLLDAEVIPPWHSARLRLEGIPGLAGREVRLLTNVQRYAATREQAWVAYSEALRHQDPQGIQRANALQADADRQLKDLGK